MRSCYFFRKRFSELANVCYAWKESHLPYDDVVFQLDVGDLCEVPSGSGQEHLLHHYTLVIQHLRWRRKSSGSDLRFLAIDYGVIPFLGIPNSVCSKCQL